MKITVTETKPKFAQMERFSPDGFYVDEEGRLYLHHLSGVSKITPTGGTETRTDHGVLVRRLSEGDKITIEF